MMGNPRSAHRSAGLGLPEPLWFEQRLDHFDPTNNRTWKQRYFVNDTLYKPGGPVFLQLGGEGTADPIWLVEGQIATNYGVQFGALLIELEHRYYGESHPTPDMSVENLKYLTSIQALADAANFVNGFKKCKHYPDIDSSLWIVFGGSYSGSLAAWMRLKYPHLIHGAVASSAPVQAVVNFADYLAVVRDSLGPHCDQTIHEATLQLAKLLEHPMGWREITQTFKLCDPLDGNNSDDVSNLVQTLAGNFEGVVQYNKDNRDFEGAVGTNVTIDVICGVMTNEANGSPLDRYAAVNKLILDTYGQKCVDYKYDNFIKTLQATEWNSSASEGGRQWTYQTCVEFGFYQSSDLSDQPFGQYFPVKFFEKMCSDIFGDNFSLELLDRAVEFTNTFYGGFGLKVRRVVFPNGSIDPWHALGIIEYPQNTDSEAVFINGTAHCADQYPSSDSDPQSLIDARIQIASFLQNILQQTP
jgi:pimeloyl-ACP methyl ester carboxylesterase